jgi:hypothetical protein
MNTMIENFINGNLTTAKFQARRFSIIRIREGFMEEYFYSFEKAQLTAEYLKGLNSFQAAVDAE